MIITIITGIIIKTHKSCVCRGRISSSGQIKLSIFGTVYTVCFAILFFYEVAVSSSKDLINTQ